jgi:hypothetical protein
MRISVVDSRAKGFKKWSDAHQPDRNDEGCAGGGDANITPSPISIMR